MPPSEARYSGRLELTWTNKDQCLPSHENGSYEWVAASDYRVVETRLLHDAGSIGQIGEDRAEDNLLIRGDALHALRSLAELREFSDELVGKVKLCYIDPPYNTGQAFDQYDDALEHSVWLTMMRDRLVQIKKLLSADGSVWVQCDDAEQAYLRVLMDEIFGRNNSVATISWEKILGRDNRTAISTAHDYIITFAKDRRAWAAGRNLLPFGEEQLARYKNPDNDPRGPWTSGDASAPAGPGRRSSQFYTLTTPSGRQVDPPSGSCWRFTQARIEELDADGRIWWGPDGNNVPRVKRFLSQVSGGLVPRSLWPAEETGSNDEAKKGDQEALSRGHALRHS